MCASVTTIKERDYKQNDFGPAEGIDFTVLDANNRIPGNLRGSPVYQLNSQYFNNEAFDGADKFISRIWLYDMNGIIYPDYKNLPESDYQLNTRFSTHPYVDISIDGQLDAFSSKTICLSTNEVAVGTQLSYRYPYPDNPYYLIDKVDWQQGTFSWRVPPQTAYKTTEPDSKYWPKVEFRAVYYLDDYGNRVLRTKEFSIYTPDWNPDNLELIISDEDSIRLKWEIEYEAESIKLYRDEICIATLAGNVTAYTDMSFALGVYNHYEVKAKYGELISINDNETNKLDVYGIAANPPKPYPLANFNKNKTSFNIKWIDNSYFEAGYSLIIEPDGGTPVNYRVLATGDTISYQAPIPIGYTSGTISILTAGPKDEFSNLFLNYSYAVNDGLPFYSAQPFAISQSKGNLSFSNGNYLIASSREYSTSDTVFSIEEYNGLQKNIIFSEFCSGERDAVASSNQDVVFYANNALTNYLQVIYKNSNGEWTKTEVNTTGIMDLNPGVETIKLHSLIEKDGYYYLLLSREFTNLGGKPATYGNKLAILKISNSNGVFTIVDYSVLLSNILTERTYYEGSLKKLSDGRIGVTYNSHQQGSTLYSGLGVMILDDDLANREYIINPPLSSTTSNYEIADFDIISSKAKLLVRRATLYQNIIELKTYEYSNEEWIPKETTNIDNKLNRDYQFLENPRVIYTNNALFLSWTYNDENNYQGIVNYKTINSSGVLSANKTALSLNKNITDYAIQNQDGLIKIIAQYYDEEITAGTYMLSEISPSYNEIALNLSNTFYGYSDETINLTAKDIFTGEAIANATVTLTNNKDFSFTGITDANGSISIPYYTESDNDMVITVDKEYYQKKVLKAFVTINNMNVSLPSDMPVLTTKALNFKVTVSDATLPDATQIPIAGATITLQSTDIAFTGITNLSGSVSCTKKTSYTTPISVTITKPRFRTFEAEIYPYMWSTTNEALGENNQTHMVRKPATSYLSIIYSDGDSIVYGSSSDFGKIWHLEKIGEGTMPTMVRRSNGITALWKNGQMLEYATMSSPWSPVDTAVYPVYSISEPNLFKHPDPTNDSIFACIIEGTELQTWGDFILASWYDVLIESMTSEVIVPYTGDEYDNTIIPFSQPIVSKYLALGNYYNLISFTTSNNQLITKLQDPFKLSFIRPFLVSNQDQIVANSAVDVYGNTSTFIWSANNLSSSEIWKRKLVDGSFTDAERVDYLTGFNSNPKVKDNFIYGYVNDAKRIVTKPDINNEFAYSVIEEAEDSLFNFDFVVKKTLTDANACFVWTEGGNGIYKIKTTEVYYGTIAQPKVISDPTETIVEYIPSSPIYNYVSGRPFVERMTYDATAMDSVLKYDVKLVVSQTNPVRPQVLMFDTTVIDVIYGTPNTVDTLQYTIPAELYTDGNVKITLDRLRGNPNRVAQIAIYEYEADTAEGTVAGNEKMLKLITKPQIPNMKYDYYLIPTFEYGNNIIRFSVAEQGEVTLNLFDVSGRCIDKMASGVFNSGIHTINLPKTLSSGVYFVKMEAGGMTLIEKLIRIK
ncbi:MAG: T9SS type A sorting domain-containing protein [bacterium]|nr:T9SS type A sorting domain-containing protein [bacterium]